MPIDHAAVHQVWVERILREDPLPPIEVRLYFMGLTTTPLKWLGGPGFGLGPYNQYWDFATRLWWGPWDRVVRRREMAKQQRIFHLRAMAWMFGLGDSYYYREIKQLEEP